MTIMHRLHSILAIALICCLAPLAASAASLHPDSPTSTVVSVRSGLLCQVMPFIAFSVVRKRCRHPAGSNAVGGPDGVLATAFMRDALIAREGSVPVIDTYRQASIRHQKAGNWAESLGWAEGGLAVYADRPSDPAAVEDLRT